MLENFLGYLEICMQLYANQKENKEVIECLNRYEESLHTEYSKLSLEDKESLKQIVSSKIMTLKMERSTIMLTQSIVAQDKKLNDVFPGHVKAQYSDKIKKFEKEIHYLESTYRSIDNSKKISR